MNPLTNIKNINKLNEIEADLGVSSSVSWHQQYKDSAYIYIGGLPYKLTEGDILAIFSQYGEIVNINLVRDKKTGKSQGYCFIAYEDQRSTILAVDNLNGFQLLGRTIRVDHVASYRAPKEHEDDDEVTLRLRKEGCAPKVEAHTPPPLIDDDDLLPLPKKAKKEKKSKKDKEAKQKKKKKKKKEEVELKKKEQSSEESSEDENTEEHRTRTDRDESRSGDALSHDKEAQKKKKKGKLKRKEQSSERSSDESTGERRKRMDDSRSEDMMHKRSPDRVESQGHQKHGRDGLSHRHEPHSQKERGREWSLEGRGSGDKDMYDRDVFSKRRGDGYPSSSSKEHKSEKGDGSSHEDRGSYHSKRQNGKREKERAKVGRRGGEEESGRERSPDGERRRDISRGSIRDKGSPDKRRDRDRYRRSNSRDDGWEDKVRDTGSPDKGRKRDRYRRSNSRDDVWEDRRKPKKKRDRSKRSHSRDRGEDKERRRGHQGKT